MADRLDTLLALARQALEDDKRVTPGPWEVELCTRWEASVRLECDDGVIADTLNADVVEIHNDDGECHVDVLGKRNLEFCAAARTREPQLAAALVAILDEPDRHNLCLFSYQAQAERIVSDYLTMTACSTREGAALHARRLASALLRAADSLGKDGGHATNCPMHGSEEWLRRIPPMPRPRTGRDIPVPWDIVEQEVESELLAEVAIDPIIVARLRLRAEFWRNEAAEITDDAPEHSRCCEMANGIEEAIAIVLSKEVHGYDPQDKHEYAAAWDCALANLGQSLAVGGALCAAWEEGAHGGFGWIDKWRPGCGRPMR